MDALKAEDIDVMKEAFYSDEGCPGPVLLNSDAQKAELDFDIDIWCSNGNPVVATMIRSAAQMVKASKAPVIKGGGCFISHLYDEVVKLAEMLQAPVVTTIVAKGGTPEDPPRRPCRYPGRTAHR